MIRTILISGIMLFCFTLEESFAGKGGASALLRSSKTRIVNPLELRDPFKRPSMKRKKTSRLGKESERLFSNIGKIGKTPLEEIKIVGVLLGKERRAIAKIKKDSFKEAYILKEGMKLGENQATIKAILPGGIILVEKITNVYDEEEYLETVLTVSDE